MEHLYEMLDSFTSLLELGATSPVDFYPLLKWIPERLLGNWRTRSYHVKGIMESLHQSMYKHFLSRRASTTSNDEKGTHTKSSSLMDKIFDNREALNFSSHKLSFIGGGLVEGGSETPACMILTFIGAMTKWPSIQQRAQSEIDAVVGEDRSPTWADYARLPYVAAITKGCSRWRPVAPLGMPHSLDAGESSRSLSRETILIIV
jgi:cytochrome P450 family 619